MYACGTHPKTIFSSLQELCKREGNQPMFLFDDLVNALSSIQGNSESFDSSNFLELLHNRKLSLGLPFDFKTRSGNLDLIFTVMEGGLEYMFSDTTFDTYRSGAKIKVMFFDTTFNTNRFGAKLGIFSTVTNMGKTQLLAVGYIAGDEDTEKFIWLFDMFKKYFLVPEVLFTDSCQKIEGAIKATFPGTIKHFLCIWHIFKNFSYHLCWMFSKQDWHSISRLFWKLARETDLRSVSLFDVEFDSFQQSLISASESLNSASRDPSR
jgi:hypothetical protein